MKNYVFGLIVICLLSGCEDILQQPRIAIDEQWETAQSAQAELPVRNTRTLKVEKKQIYQGDLLLVNKDHQVRPEGVKDDVIKLLQHKELVNGYVLLDQRIRLSQSVAQKFSAMVDAAAKEGVVHFAINSGYRDAKEQDQLYQKMGDNYALPAGYSEHNVGLSLDVGSTQLEMNRAPEGQWLEENAWAYGFILRYPKDKTETTGIRYEPWHFRYVGLPHSAIMQEKHFVLEEYLDYLKAQKTISTTIKNKKYKISYHPISKNTTIPVPSDRRYELSGNNIDGVIVTELP